MILKCEHCHTRYLLPDHMLGPEGRKVRCTNCAHEWFQEPEDDTPAENFQPPADLEPIPEAVRPLPENSELPVLHHSAMQGAAAGAGGNSASYAAGFLVFIATFGLLVMLHGPVGKAWPSSAAFYDLLGIHVPFAGEGLVFDQVSAKVAENPEGERSLHVEGKIINLKRDAMDIPPVTLALRRADGIVVDNVPVTVDKQTLDGEGEITFKTDYPKAPADLKDVNLQFAETAGPAKEKAEEPAEESPASP
jgi:predicted Zn finger-like uncharacterized protein